MIETILTICALTMISPYYDCSEEWDIVIYDDKYIPGTESALGQARYNNLLGVHEIRLVSYHNEATGKHDYMLYGGGVLWHEIVHMMCECDWHKIWDKETIDSRSHKFGNSPVHIPEDVKPYIKPQYHFRR